MADPLDDLRSAGRLDSVGRFTLDPARAADLLARFRFQSPYEYVLKLVQAGVAAGATWVDVRAGGSGVTVGWREVPLADEPVEHLLRHAFEPSPERWRTHLGVGLVGALGLRPTEMEVCSRTGGHGFRRTWRQGVEERADDSGPGEGTRLTLRGLDRLRRTYAGPKWFGWGRALRQCGLLDLAREWGCRSDSEATQVWRRCIYAPVPVLLNGSLANNPWFGLPRHSARVRGGVGSVIPGGTGWEFSGLRVLAASEWGPDVFAGPAGIPMTRRQMPVGPTLPMNPLLHAPCLSYWTVRTVTERVPAPLSIVQRTKLLELPYRKVGALAETTLLGAAHIPDGPLRLWGLPPLPCHALVAEQPPRGPVTLVHDGVVIRQAQPPTSVLRNRLAVCSAASLDLDLSGFAPVENDRWHALLAALNQLG